MQPVTTSPAFNISTSIQARLMASRVVAGLTPRSNRPDASVRMPCARLVRRMAVRLKLAHSNITSVVASVISLSSPPITPPMPVAPCASQINRSFGVNVRFTPSSVVSCSPSLARRTMISRPFTLRRSKACIGWPYSIITKLVMSTMLLIGRRPAPVRYLRSHLGEGATRTFLITRAV